LLKITLWPIYGYNQSVILSKEGRTLD